MTSEGFFLQRNSRFRALHTKKTSRNKLQRTHVSFILAKTLALQHTTKTTTGDEQACTFCTV